MDAPFSFDSSNAIMDEFFDFDAFPQPASDLGMAEPNAESALASPLAPPCMQGGDEAASSDVTTSVASNRSITAADAASESVNLEAPGKSSTELCSCPRCTYTWHDFYYGKRGHPCDFDCGYYYEDPAPSLRHYKTHFQDEQYRYRCKAPNCDTTCSRWGELTRHYQTHCPKPDIFPCDVIGCKYGGHNGFKRYDKLLSHKRNVHEGKAAPDQLMRVQKRKLAPKA